MRWTFPGELTVVDARPRDALALLSLQREVYAEREWFITLPQELILSVEEKSRFLRDVARSANAVVLVARMPQASVVGQVTVLGGDLERMRHVGKLEIQVHPAHRGRGVGRALMASAIAWAQGNALVEKLGLSVFATNERAIALYRSFGFEDEGLRRGEYRFEDGSYRDELLMYRWVRQGPT